MENLDTNDTQPMPVGEPEPLPASQAPKKKRSPWLGLTLIGLLALVIILAISGYAGYSAGINRRQQAEQAMVSFKTSEQFELALQDIEARQYQRARQRLEYIAQIDPEFPGLTERLAEVLTHGNIPPTPVPELIATPIPIQNTGDLERLYAQGQQAFLDKDWTTAIETLLLVRKNDPAYNAVAIDGILFLALRNRGMDKISKQADLEGGMYDLTLASLFGPLDNEAQGFMNWVSFYITGASFWELDWEKVIEYFSELSSALPGLSDRSGMTARERYRLALKNWGLLLVQRGDACAAVDQFTLSLEVGPDPEVDTALGDAVNQCQGAGSNESEPTSAPSESTPTPTFTIIETIPPPIEITPSPPPIEITPSPPPTASP